MIHPFSRTYAVRTLFALLLALPLACVSAVGCSSVYYSAMEKMGKEKRDLLVDRVEDARDDQNAAKEQFTSALAQFKAVTGFDGGDLEQKYDTLRSEYERCEKRAEEVRKEIRSVEQVAADLFDEWKDEIGEMKDASLKSRSQELRQKTQQRYEQMITAMKRAEAKMDPVLTAFRDQVLFLKHNLNSKAIASLGGQVKGIEGDVSLLVKDMEKSIAEANAFLDTLKE